MAARVRDFAVAHPSDEAGHQEVVAELVELLARADTLERKQNDGIARQRAANARRLAIRWEIRTQYLPGLVKVGKLLAKDRPDLALRFRMPEVGGPLRSYLAETKSMFTLAQENSALFTAKGLPASLLDDLARAMGQFDEATETANRARREHVGAGADLTVVADDILELVGALDGMARYRFRDDAELMGQWRSARSRIEPSRTRAEPEPEPAPEPAPDGNREEPAA